MLKPGSGWCESEFQNKFENAKQKFGSKILDFKSLGLCIPKAFALQDTEPREYKINQKCSPHLTPCSIHKKTVSGLTGRTWKEYNKSKKGCPSRGEVPVSLGECVPERRMYLVMSGTAWSGASFACHFLRCVCSSLLVLSIVWRTGSCPLCRRRNRGSHGGIGFGE